MSVNEIEPWAFASLEDLLEMARAMEQEAISGYIALSQRMTAMDRPDLAAVFDGLVREETEHLDAVRVWSDICGSTGMPPPLPAAEHRMFDDEGAGVVAPELLSAYRAFSIAVRNEERAFLFWTYVSAHAQSDEIRQAAERMAREELGHVAKLRRERRLAFHRERNDPRATEQDLQTLEEALLQRLAGIGEHNTDAMKPHALAAQTRVHLILNRPFQQRPRLKQGIGAQTGSALPLAEVLLDGYLELGDLSKGEEDADRARKFAAQLISTIRTLRHLAPNPSM